MRLLIRSVLVLVVALAWSAPAVAQFQAPPLPAGAARDTSVDQIENLLSTLDGRVDGLETLLTNISGFVDGLEGLVDGLEGQLSTLDGRVDGLEGGLGAAADAAATAGSTGSVSAKLRLVTSQLDALATELAQKTEPANNQAVNLAQVLGATHSATNPLFVRMVDSDSVLPDDVADGAAISGGPPSLPIGCHAEATPAAVTEDQKSDASCTLLGAWYVATNGTDNFNVNNISGTISLPTGASSAANQTTIIGHVDGLEASLAELNDALLDFDTTGATVNRVAFGVILPSASGPVIGGTSTNPFRVDVTGTTTQPVSAASLPLPSGAATDASVDGLEGGVGAAADAAATAGSTGSLSAKLRLVTSQLDTLNTNLQPSTGALIRSDNTNNDDETEIKATPGVLLAISGRNNHASANAFVRCTNATAANTTPGSTTVIYELMLPWGGGWVQGSLGPVGRTFATALTCYVATGEAVSDTTDAAQDDVVVNVDFR